MDLQDETNFSATELQVLMRHFTDLTTADDRLDKATFFKYLSQGKQAPTLHIQGSHEQSFLSKPLLQVKRV